METSFFKFLSTQYKIEEIGLSQYKIATPEETFFILLERDIPYQIDILTSLFRSSNLNLAINRRAFELERSKYGRDSIKDENYKNRNLERSKFQDAYEEEDSNGRNSYDRRRASETKEDNYGRRSRGFEDERDRPFGRETRRN